MTQRAVRFLEEELEVGALVGVMLVGEEGELDVLKESTLMPTEFELGPGAAAVSGPGAAAVSGPGAAAVLGPGAAAVLGPGAAAVLGPGAVIVLGPRAAFVLAGKSTVELTTRPEASVIDTTLLFGICA